MRPAWPFFQAVFAVAKVKRAAERKQLPVRDGRNLSFATFSCSNPVFCEIVDQPALTLGGQCDHKADLARILFPLGQKDPG